MIVQRAEQHIIDRHSKWYKLLAEKCHIAKNIYNHANYLIRQEFTSSGQYLNYYTIEKLMKTDEEYPDYWGLGLANSSQQILRRLDSNWTSFFRSIKDWKKNPGKYTGMPKLPKYLPKDGMKEFALTTNQAKLKDNMIKFTKSLKGFTLYPNFIFRENFVGFQQARIIPRNDRIIVELIYNVNISDKPKQAGAIGSIDLGIDNFVTFVDSLGNKPIIINGKGLKSVNRYYNKLIAETKSKLGRNRYSHKLYSITNKRNDKVDNFMHQASKYIVEECKAIGISQIVIGKNDGWKQEVNLGKVNNQKFVNIPYQSFINKLTYKCQEANIEVILTEESYTSGTSFLDNELPIKENYNKSRRIKRGLFKSNEGKFINADVNGAYQIMKKVFPDVERPRDIGLVMNPVKVNLSF